MRAIGMAAMLVVIAGAACAADSMPGWQVRTEPDGGKCRAVLFGPQVDTQIMRSSGSKLVLVAGHRDWKLGNGPVHLTIQADGGPALAFTGTALGRTVSFLVSDDAQSEAIRHAGTLTWHFPWGDFTSQIAGLGATFSQLGPC
jgi:hypothetical protein